MEDSFYLLIIPCWFVSPDFRVLSVLVLQEAPTNN